jgi:putative ABC transport system substrate-binding protein
MQFGHLKRREIIVLGASAAAVAWPGAAVWGQQIERLRRVGMLMTLARDDAYTERRITAFREGLKQAGWTEGHNLQIDIRWSGGDPVITRSNAAELVALSPDVIFTTGPTGTAPLLQVTRTIPIVFVAVPDPVGAGLVDSLARPGGNATGFANVEYGVSGKWLELLKEVAPDVTRVGVIRDPTIATGIGALAAIQSVAPSLRVDTSPLSVRNAADIEEVVAAFARLGRGGLIVTGSALAIIHRDLIVALVARHKLPAVYFDRILVAAGGLISYGPDLIDQHRRAAGYVDRILRGQKPANLPVQEPAKYELVVNLKTARALGRAIPPTVLARADEVIE